MITRAWMEQLGVEDGTVLAGRVLELTAERPTSTEQICDKAVAAVRECASLYKERGVSDSLVAAWRSACIGEISRRFAEYRAELGDSDEPEELEDADELEEAEMLDLAEEPELVTAAQH